MVSQSCPRCASPRVRRGYRPTPLWSKFIFRYHLLCDNCNWEFAGFAVPGTVSSKPTKKRKKNSFGNNEASFEDTRETDAAEGEERKKKKTRTKIKF